MLASTSCITGDIDTLYSSLNDLNANVKSFEDSLTSSSLLAKLLTSQSKYKDAMDNCLSILSTLGEEFPQDVTLPMVLNELSVVQTTLANITVDQVKRLPRMVDKNKLYAMKFLSMLCACGIIANPLLVPILSCRSKWEFFKPILSPFHVLKQLSCISGEDYDRVWLLRRLHYWVCNYRVWIGKFKSLEISN